MLSGHGVLLGHVTPVQNCTGVAVSITAEQSYKIFSTLSLSWFAKKPELVQI